MSNASTASDASNTTCWVGARWFDGTHFVPGTRCGAGGVFTPDAQPPAGAKVVDLSGLYVTPPFGDAHHHGIDSEQGLDAKIRAFLDAGIFYVKNPNVIPDLLTPAVRAKINRPDSIDVVFSNGGLTSTGGHPAPLHDMLARQHVFPGLGPGDMENHAYFFVDDAKMLDAKWPMILAGKPDFIKTFLVFSDGQIPPDMPPALGKGLNPAVLPLIVQHAHAAGLRVSSHINSAVDFRVAVDAGVDEINHVPFITDRALCERLPAQCFIEPEVAARAAARHIMVVSTQAPHPGDPHASGPDVEWTIGAQRRNFATLMAAGVSIAMGSDGISGEDPLITARFEVMYLHEHHFADDLALLKMWTETTAATIFPARRLGHLDPGYEASFLALEGDPTADFDSVTRIRRRVKQGVDLGAPPVR